MTRANFFDTELITLKIMNSDGETREIKISTSDTIDTLKFIVPTYFQRLELPSKRNDNFKLVLTSKNKVLSSENTIATEGLKNNDEILLVPKRFPPKTDPLTDENLKGPGQFDIDKATVKLRETPKERRCLPVDSPIEFQTELRKLIISIVEVAARVLAHTPQANQIIELMRERQLRKSRLSVDSKGYGVSLETTETGSGSLSGRDARVPQIPDPAVVAQMIDMGFSEDLVMRALRSRRMNQAQALEWLLENSPSEAGSWSTADDDDDDDDVEDVDLEDDASIPVVENIDGQTRWRSDVNSGGQDHDQGHFLLGVGDEAAVSTVPNEDGGSASNQENVKSWSAAELLRSFDAFKKQQFRPSPKAMNALVEMGFAVEDVIEALKATGNRQVAACDWLLSEKKTKGASSASSSSSSSWEEADEGLDPNSPVFKAILAEPLVQLSLTNPKILLAYLSILETPSSAGVWINDIDASPVINQIFKTYSAEKYTLETPEEEESGAQRRATNSD